MLTLINQSFRYLDLRPCFLFILVCFSFNYNKLLISGNNHTPLVLHMQQRICGFIRKIKYYQRRRVQKEVLFFSSFSIFFFSWHIITYGVSLLYVGPTLDRALIQKHAERRREGISWMKGTLSSFFPLKICCPFQIWANLKKQKLELKGESVVFSKKALSEREDLYIAYWIK